ncbi:MAG: hypothetical protein R3F19_33030 [Verrucomicrobiales bacterium]
MTTLKIMKLKLYAPVVSFIVLMTLMIPVACEATEVGAGTIEQPINLCERSDPGRIPLGRVGTVSNYNYGVHHVISDPRPCPGGAMRWGGGSELDQNLASVFGISVEPEDSTSVPRAPVTLRLKSWAPPAYSPYSKEQVLVATLWCLLRSCNTSLEVKIDAEGNDDKYLEKKYSGIFFIMGTEDERKGTRLTEATGTVLKEDERGIAWVIFPGVEAKHAFEPMSPAMILFDRSGGDNASADGKWFLLPVWGDGNEDAIPLHLNQWTAPMAYSCFRRRGRLEANAFLLAGGSSAFRSTRGKNGAYSVSISYPGVPEDTLAANILALVVATQPTEACPLTVEFTTDGWRLSRYGAFNIAKDWVREEFDHGMVAFRCEFAWDASSQKLTKGSVPGVRFDGHSLIYSEPPQELPSEMMAKKIADEVYRRINRELHSGTLQAEKIMNDRQLAGSGLSRELGMAGYYAGLAWFCSQNGVTENLFEISIHFGNSDLDQYHRVGWYIGLNRGLTITQEVRKEFEEASEKEQSEASSDSSAQ